MRAKHKPRAPQPSRSVIARWVGIHQCLATTVLGIFCLLLSVTPGYAQDLPQGPTFHLESKLVNLWVNVTDANGAFVGGLTKNDFKVFEDGRPQEIRIFERESNQPLTLILAIDTSESTFKDRALERAAAHKFVQALMRPQDQMSLYQFATDVTQLVPFTNNVKALDYGLAHMRRGEATSVYDTIYLASDQLAKRDGRKVLVLVSDGGDTASYKKYDEAVAAALRGDVMIYSIIDVPIEASAGRDLGGEHALITLSEQTGGKSFYADQAGLDAAFQKVSDDLRTQYLIAYYPHNQVPGQSFHRVTVTIPRAAPGAFNLRYRTGYFSGPPPEKRYVPSG